jgi:hypothetical protein
VNLLLINERGNTLLIVMVTTLVMVTIGLAVVSSTIGGAKRTEVRETATDITYTGLKSVEEISIGLVRALRDEESFKVDQLTDNLLISSFNSPVNDPMNSAIKTYFKDNILSEFDSRESVKCVTIIDVSGEKPFNLTENQCLPDNQISSLRTFELPFLNSNLTRVYEIIVQTQSPDTKDGKAEKTVRKRIILSPLPSFLKYAVGAGGTLFLNGSPNIVGDVYANSFEVNEKANFTKQNNTEDHVTTPFPSILQDIYTSYKQTNYDKIEKYLNDDYFYDGTDVPGVKQDSQFTHINFEKTFNDEIQKVMISAGISTEDLLNANLPEIIPAGILDKLPIDLPIKKFKKIIIDDGVSASKLIVNGDVTLIGKEPINIGEIIASGDVSIRSSNSPITVGSIISGGRVSIESNESISIEGNIVGFKDVLVRTFDNTSKIKGNIFASGDLIIQGNATNERSNTEEDEENDNILFDSVIYSKGKTTISNLNVLGLPAEGNKPEGKLILLSQGDLLMTRMNEYRYFAEEEERTNIEKYQLLPHEDEQIKPLNGFFYTEKNASLYGVGSLFYVNGGVFSKGDLTINAVRGNVEDIDRVNQTIQPGKLSRFIVNYDKNILLRKLDTLPSVESLSLISDDIIVH